MPMNYKLQRIALRAWPLTAKDSAIATRENRDSGLPIPQGAEPRLAAVAIGKGDKGEFFLLK